MKHYIMSFIKRRPLESFLYLYSLGVFSFTSTIGLFIKQATSQAASNIYWMIPNEILELPIVRDFDSTKLLNMIQQSPFRWLITSILMTIVLRFFGRLFRTILSLIIIGVGAYLVYIYLKTHSYIQ